MHGNCNKTAETIYLLPAVSVAAENQSGLFSEHYLLIDIKRIKKD